MLHKSSVLTVVVCGGIAIAGASLVAWQQSHTNAAEPGAPQVHPVANQARQIAMDHMKTIMLAIHNYNSFNGHFPARAIFGAGGEPRLSWRVALLPFLDQEALFREFRLDESWDSPHNKALIARMPEVFTTPGSSPVGVGMTRIRVFEGPGTLFNGNRGTRIEEMTDGTSNTVAIVAGRDAVPWTRPGDLPFLILKGTLQTKLDDSAGTDVVVGIADGSARYVPRGDEALWSKLVTPAGGEVVVWPGLANEMPQQGQGGTPLLTPATATPLPVVSQPSPPIAPDLDARLRAIEANIERILRKLDARDNSPAPH